MCDIVLAGVGGQGLMVLSSVIGHGCLREGVKVVTAEDHGLAQRSGSIHVHVRIGEKYSPLIPYGCADFLIGMEALEALRYVEYVRDGGFILVNKRVLHPIVETHDIAEERDEKREYVTLEQVVAQLRKVTENVFVVDALELARRAGHTRAENMVLLGAACALPGFPLKKGTLLEAIKDVLPEKWVEVNVKAFEVGWGEGMKAKK